MNSINLFITSVCSLSSIMLPQVLYVFFFDLLSLWSAFSLNWHYSLVLILLLFFCVQKKSSSLGSLISILILSLYFLTNTSLLSFIAHSVSKRLQNSKHMASPIASNHCIWMKWKIIIGKTVLPEMEKIALLVWLDEMFHAWYVLEYPIFSLKNNKLKLK